ncbi:MAG: hypothetical protein K2L51_07510 [Clostridiales bacterium]|nr:hypothetical protein [Clostridiales bacterium]
MKNRLQMLCTAALLTVCLNLFGGWTNVAPEPTEYRYGDAHLLSVYSTETVSFISKDTSVQNATAGNAPKYYAPADLSDACGAVAGAIVVGYYDKYFPDLIDGWTSHFSSGKYRKQDQTYIPAVIRELYTSMRTNIDGKGVSENDFLNGLRQYVSARNHTAAFTCVATESSIDFAACKNAIDNNSLIVLFAHAGNVYQYTGGANTDSIETVTVTDSHIMIAYGYFQIKYYNASGLFRTDTYLQTVVTNDSNSAYFYKTETHNLASAYIVNIT